MTELSCRVAPRRCRVSWIFDDLRLSATEHPKTEHVHSNCPIYTAATRRDKTDLLSRVARCELNVKRMPGSWNRFEHVVRCTTTVCWWSGMLFSPASSAYRCYICRTRRGLCVCVCVGHTGELCKNGRTDRDDVWGPDSCGPKKPLLDGGSRSHTRMDTLRKHVVVT